MRRILYALIYGLLAVVLIGAVTNIKREKHVTDPNEYTIEYVGVYSGREERLDDFLFAEDGEYPTGYVFGEGAEISALLGEMTLTENEGESAYVGTPVTDPKDENKTYRFYGWYLDSECTQEFDGVIGKRQTGDITIYAQIEVEHAIEYVGVYDGKRGEIEAFLFKENGAYPTTYRYGESRVVDDLCGKMEKMVVDGHTYYVGSEINDPTNDYKAYGFYGWYLDAACTKPFDGEISASQKGLLTLYAKISVSWWTAMY